MTKNTDTISKARPKIKLLTPKIIYAKILFTYTALYTLAFFVGCIFFHSLELTSGQYVSEILANNFLNSFSDCKNIFEIAFLMLEMSKADITHLAIIFMSGFTMITGLIGTAVFAFRGFSLGFSVSYLASAVTLGELQSDRTCFSVFVFSVICAMSTVVLIHFAVKTSCFCDEFKTLCGRLKLIIRSKALYKQIFRFLIAFGAILILNLIRCVL